MNVRLWRKVLKMRKNKYLYQTKRDVRKGCCFPISIINYCLYNKIKVVKLRHLIKNTNIVKNGGASQKEEWECLKKVKEVKWKPTYELQKVINNGILSMWHPDYGLHSVFCYKKDGRYYLINSLLGGVKRTMKLNEIMKYIPQKERHWYGDYNR